MACRSKSKSRQKKLYETVQNNYFDAIPTMSRKLIVNELNPVLLPMLSVNHLCKVIIPIP